MLDDLGATRLLSALLLALTGEHEALDGRCPAQPDR
jgi:hypothetical protein